MNRRESTTMRRATRIGAALAGALMIAACGGPTEQATPTPQQQPTPAPAPIVSPDKLDVGGYPTTPRPALGVAGNAPAGIVAEAQHMADFVVGPWDVDPDMVHPYLSSTYLITAPAALEQIGPATVAVAAEQRGMVGGFVSARQAPDKSILVNGVLRFPDPAAATAAAGEMSQAAAQQSIQGATPTSTAIPGHADAVASTYPFTPHGSERPWAAVRSFTPRGPFVLMQMAQSIDGLDPAAAMVAKAIDLQGPLIDQFAPTPIDALADVALDPTGLLVRTIPAEAGTAPASKNAAYSPRGAVHFQSNPVGSATLFDDAGVTVVAMGEANVYEAKDAPSASLVANSFGKEVSVDGVSAADPVPALPGSRCLQFPKGFYCVASGDRYAIEVQAEQLKDAHQQVAAQYVMLTAH
jgi:hypothetical protein